MRKRPLLLTALCVILLPFSNAAYAGMLPYNNVFAFVSNDNGTRYSGDQVTWGAPAGSYYVSFAGYGKGLNSLHVTTDLSNVNGQVNTVNTTTGSASGTLWVTDTGGRGYDDDIILMIAASGTISNNFQVNVKSSGYSFAPGTPSTAVYVNNALNETFTKSNFLYGPQTYRLSSMPDYPFYSGQDTSDPSTAMNFMLVDLYIGALSGSSGAVGVTYSFSGLTNQILALNAYAWNGSSNVGSGMNWTNATSNSYMVNSAPAPVPIPPAILLFGSGLAGMIFVRRRNAPAAGA